MGDVKGGGEWEDKGRMMNNKKAIIIAANLKGNFEPSNKDVGNVLAHASLIEKEGAALWGIVPPGKERGVPFRHPDIRRGYFYNVTDKAVTHVFECAYIRSGVDLGERKAKRFLIEARKEQWIDRRDRFYWAKITNIYRLQRVHKLEDFTKVSNNKPLEHLRNYAIVCDPMFKHHNSTITRREVMSDYIADLLVRGEVTEKDIEELFSYRLADTLTLVDRQGSFKKGGRLDLLYKNHLGNYIIYELKKDIAKLSALDQVKRYMNASIKKYKIDKKKVKGRILSKSIDPDLARAVAKEHNIEVQTYSFSISVK